MGRFPIDPRYARPRDLVEHPLLSSIVSVQRVIQIDEPDSTHLVIDLNTRDKKQLVIVYEHLINDWSPTVTRLGSAYLLTPIGSEEIGDAVANIQTCLNYGDKVLIADLTYFLYSRAGGDFTILTNNGIKKSQGCTHSILVQSGSGMLKVLTCLMTQEGTTYHRGVVINKDSLDFSIREST